MSNPFAVRFREAAFTLEDTNIPEIAEMLHIASREIERLEAQCEGMGQSCIANAGWILQLEAALRELHAQVAQGFECYDAKMSPSTHAAMAEAERLLGSPSRPDNLSTGSALSDTGEP